MWVQQRMAEAFWSRVGLFLFEIEFQNSVIVSVIDIPTIVNMESEANSDNDLGQMTWRKANGSNMPEPV